MQIVTGGAGFIGSNLVHALTKRGHRVVVVDDLTDGVKFANLVGAPIHDYIDKDRFAAMLAEGDPWLNEAQAVLHQGACATTTEWDGRMMMANNFEYSKKVLEFCLARRIPLIYASSAAVYGRGKYFAEDSACESPLNVYGYSKLLFDEVVGRIVKCRSGGSQIVGLRYFNVYGPRETHKGSMASVAYHLWRQLGEGNSVRLFRGADGYGDGEQRRDFVYVDDVVATICGSWTTRRRPASSMWEPVGAKRSGSWRKR